MASCTNVPAFQFGMMTLKRGAVAPWNDPRAIITASPPEPRGARSPGRGTLQSASRILQLQGPAAPEIASDRRLKPRDSERPLPRPSR